MKANRKFLNDDDEAVSPVIAVILMVAITVVLAATVYVWVSGFGSQSSQPAKTLSMTSSGTLSGSLKSYTIASATPGLRWSDLKVTVEGAEHNINSETCSATSFTDTTSYRVCSGGTAEANTGTVDAGDQFTIGNVASGNTLRILDSQANSVILTLVVG